MRNIFQEELQELIEAPHYLPSVSVLLPFEPKMNAKQELQQRLRQLYMTVKQKLSAEYPPERVSPVLEKLKQLSASLDFTTYKRSICIFVSPVAEKVLYLSVPVEERIVIDETFQIRDVVYNKKQERKCLVLLLSAQTTRLHLVENDRVSRVVCDLPVDISEIVNDAPERVSNFSDPSSRRENLLHKFLRQVDNSLGLILETYPYPLLVAGADRVLGHFRAMSKHANHVLSYIPGNFIDASERALLTAVKPVISNWQDLKQQAVLKEIEKAGGASRLVYGINNVWQAARKASSRLLVVEKNFRYEADKVDEEAIVPHEEGRGLHIKDAVDDVIENVLRSGGDVEFVDDGQLAAFGRIALVRYFSPFGRL
ncbi:MAG TPA: hypothetical protein VF145_09800 [Chitinophagaceae bacterium]